MQRREFLTLMGTAAVGSALPSLVLGAESSAAVTKPYSIGLPTFDQSVKLRPGDLWLHLAHVNSATMWFANSCAKHLAKYGNKRCLFVSSDLAHCKTSSFEDGGELHYVSLQTAKLLRDQIAEIRPDFLVIDLMLRGRSGFDLKAWAMEFQIPILQLVQAPRLYSRFLSFAAAYDADVITEGIRAHVGHKIVEIGNIKNRLGPVFESFLVSADSRFGKMFEAPV